MNVAGLRQTWPIRGKTFCQWLARAYYEATGGAAGSEALQGALGIVEAKAQFDGHERPVSVRVAGHEGRLYLDLGDPSWRAIEITATGWRVVADPPVRFRRSGGMRPLPLPVRGGSISALRPFLNGDGPKPKWMRWQTFHRLVERHDEFVHRSWVGMAVKLRMTGPARATWWRH